MTGGAVQHTMYLAVFYLYDDSKTMNWADSLVRQALNFYLDYAGYQDLEI